MFLISFMAKEDQSGFEEATESEIELFKKGEIQLYNVEYIAMVSEIKSVSEEEVDNALEGIGFEVKEGWWMSKMCQLEWEDALQRFPQWADL